MTGGEIAGLIAAIAFLLLVIFIGVFLLKVIRTLNQVESTISSITDDVDVISQQTGKILASSDTLIKDLNDKLNEVDPVFKASADLGESVSDLNDSTRQMIDRVHSKNKVGLIGRLWTGLAFLKSHRKKNEK